MKNRERLAMEIAHELRDIWISGHEDGARVRWTEAEAAEFIARMLPQPRRLKRVRGHMMLDVLTRKPFRFEGNLVLASPGPHTVPVTLLYVPPKKKGK